MTFCSNLVLLFHAHFVLSALEEARRVAKAVAFGWPRPAPAEVPEGRRPRKNPMLLLPQRSFLGPDGQRLYHVDLLPGLDVVRICIRTFNSDMGWLIYGCIISPYPSRYLLGWATSCRLARRKRMRLPQTKLGWRGRILFYAAVVMFPLALNDMKRGTSAQAVRPGL